MFSAKYSAFTGCDATSSFNGNGKKTSDSLIRRDSRCRGAMKDLDGSFVTIKNNFTKCEKVNVPAIRWQCRYCEWQLFCSKITPQSIGHLAEIHWCNTKRTRIMLLLYGKPVTYSVINFSTQEGHSWLTNENGYVVAQMCSRLSCVAARSLTVVTRPKILMLWC